MSKFSSATKSAILRHGRVLTFTRVQEGAYDVETGTTTNTTTDSSIRMYKKHIRANQYNYPNLGGRDAGEFYILASDLAQKPESRDTITDGSSVYSIDSVRNDYIIIRIKYCKYRELSI